MMKPVRDRNRTYFQDSTGPEPEPEEVEPVRNRNRVSDNPVHRNRRTEPVPVQGSVTYIDCQMSDHAEDIS